MTAPSGDAADVVLALSTAPDADTAERIARVLVDERLVACTSLVPGLVSVYRWQGEVQRDSEVLLLMKTRRERVPQLKERFSQLHPYQVPELVVTEVVDGLEPYCAWVRTETDG